MKKPIDGPILQSKFSAARTEGAREEYLERICWAENAILQLVFWNWRENRSAGLEVDGQDLGRVSGETGKLLKTNGSHSRRKDAADTQSNASSGISDAFKAGSDDGGITAAASGTQQKGAG